MDVTLQRHCARYIYVVPDGLRELLSDISKEVLRSQPEDIYTFIADYLDALLITRENARISAQFVQNISDASETIVDLFKRTGMPREDADRTCEVIQEAFKTWYQKKTTSALKEDEEATVARIIEQVGIPEIKVQEAAMVIQNAFKAYKLRKQRESKMLAGIIDWRVAARSAIKLYRRSGVSAEEAKRAANLIKAAYKGYYTRRTIRLLNEPASYESMPKETESTRSSFASMSTEEQAKTKGVRIDYNTVIPHVEFGDEELISRDMTVDDEPEPAVDKDVYIQIFGRGQSAKSEKEITEAFARQLIREMISNASGNGPLKLPIMDEDEATVDNFLSYLDEDEPTHPRTGQIQQVTQQELDQELSETKKEMKELQEMQKHEEEQEEQEQGEE